MNQKARRFNDRNILKIRNQDTCSFNPFPDGLGAGQLNKTNLNIWEKMVIL